MVERVLLGVVREALLYCGKKYDFNGEEALSSYVLEVGVNVVEKVVREKVVRDKCVVLPFVGVCDVMCCEGVKKNHGLYTQCESKKEKGDYCVKCSVEALSNANVEPSGGCMRRRMSTDALEYRDNKGNKVIHYSKVMKKLKLTKEEVLTYASNKNIKIPLEYLEEVVKAKKEKIVKDVGDKKRGRPKKEVKALEVDATEDLFASLVKDSVKIVNTELYTNNDVPVINDTKKEETDAKKAAIKAENDAKKAAIKAENDAKKIVEKAENDAKKAAIKAENDAKKIVEKAENDAKKVAIKAENDAKKIAEKVANKKVANKKVNNKKVNNKKVENEAEKKVDEELVEEEVEEEEDAATVTVKKFEHKGVQYLKSSENVIYDANTQDVVGKWNETTQDIDEVEEEEEEEEEE